MFLLEGEREVKHKVADRNAKGKLAGIRITLKPDEACGFLAGGEFGVLEGESAELRGGGNDRRVIAVGGLRDMFTEVIRADKVIRSSAGCRRAVSVISDGAARRLRVRLGEEHLMVDDVRELRGILREEGFQVRL